LLLDLQVRDPADPLHGLRHLGRRAAQAVQLGTEDADDDGAAGAGQDLLDPFLQIREDVPVESRIALHDLVDLRDRPLVVHLRVHADPQLGEVRSHHLVRDLRPSDVRAEVPDARYRPQLPADAHGDAPHGIERGPGLLDPVHQEVVFLELRQELLP
jgi:hypothetical protein